MGRFTEKTELKEGFLKELLQKLQSNLNAEQVNNFANLDNDEARFRFVIQDPNLKEFSVSRNASIKNVTLALEFKQKGNSAFQRQDWKSALDFYNKGLLLLPAENGKYGRVLVYLQYIKQCRPIYFYFFETKSHRIFGLAGKPISSTLSYGTI